MNVRIGMGISLGLALAALLMTPGCGSKKVTERAAEKVAEKALETALSTDGQKVDVNIDQKNQSMTMKVKSEDGSGEDVDMSVSGDGNDINMTTTNGGSVMNIATGANAKLPANFPKDIPLYPGLALGMVQSIDTGTFSIQATSADPLDKVAGHFKKELIAQGWTEQMSMNQGGETQMHMLNYQKDERMLSLMIMTEDGKTNLTLTTGKQ